MKPNMATEILYATDKGGKSYKFFIDAELGKEASKHKWSVTSSAKDPSKVQVYTQVRHPTRGGRTPWNLGRFVMGIKPGYSGKVVQKKKGPDYRAENLKIWGTPALKADKDEATPKPKAPAPPKTQTDPGLVSYTLVPMFGIARIQDGKLCILDAAADRESAAIRLAEILSK
jgi:hypothetical protein